MSLTTILIMALILSVVWGGFLIAIFTALKKERIKTQAATKDNHQTAK